MNKTEAGGVAARVGGVARGGRRLGKGGGGKREQRQESKRTKHGHARVEEEGSLTLGATMVAVETIARLSHGTTPAFSS